MFNTSIVLSGRYVASKPKPNDYNKNYVTMEATTIFLFSTFQYVTLAFVYSKGPPFRQPITKNCTFLLALLVLTAVNIFLTLRPFAIIDDWLGVSTIAQSTPNPSFRF